MSTKFPVNSHRIDPYKNFKFKVIWEGRPVASLSKAGAVKQSIESIEWREASDPSMVRKTPGRTKCEPFTIERGLTHDTKFLEWVKQITDPSGRSDTMSLKNYRKDIDILIHNLQGVPVKRITLHRAWPSEFQASPELDSNANAIAIETMKLEYEGATFTDLEVPEV